MTQVIDAPPRESRRPRQSGLHPLASGVTLALWQWQRHWLLLLMIGLGMIASVILVCTAPLLSETMATAGLRDVLRATPTSSEITATASVAGLSTQEVEQAYQGINPSLRRYLGDYLGGTPRSEIQTPLFSILSPPPLDSADQMGIYATPIATAASHVQLVQGRLPRTTGSNVEIAITPETASLLRLHVGSVITLNWLILPYAESPIGTNVPFSMHVVGIFHVSETDAFWHGYNFLPVPAPGDRFDRYLVLGDEQNMLAAFDRVAASHHIGDVFFLQPTLLTWYYRLDPTRISINQLDDLISRLGETQAAIAANFSNPTLIYQPPYMGLVDLSGLVFHTSSGPGTLEKFRGQIAVARIPVVILAAQVLGLMLFFVSIMAGLLIDRQADAIAQLRSRGASRLHVFSAFLTQTGALGLVALLIGLPLAVVTTYLSARSLLPPASQDAITGISNAPLQALAGVALYGIGAALVTVVATMLSLYRASRSDIWATNQRRAAFRRPLWQQFNLDLVAVVIALTAYGLSVYLTGIENLLDAQTQSLVVAPLALLAPVFLLLAAILLFLRLFPLLLYIGSGIGMRGRGAAPMLALAQMARTPRQSLRMILLLALTIAFAVFSLVFAATQTQRATDVATYQAGADFSGAIPDSANHFSLPQETALYHRIPGVLNASAGYQEDDVSAVSTAPLPIRLQAIDPGTFGQTALWPAQNSTQSLPALLAQLAAQRTAAIHSGVLPAIVDATTWNELNLHSGSTFSLYQSGQPDDSMHYIVIAEAQHIPTLNSVTEGGVLVDYASFAAVQTRNTIYISANHIWLHTQSSPTALESVRAAVNAPALHLDNLYDRYALTESLRDDPIFLNLFGLLAVGATAALLLALLGNLLTSWLSVRRRLTSFSVLRAVGAAPRQIASVLVLEQGVIYASGLFLGLVLGTLLAVTAVPTLVFSVLPVRAVTGNMSNNDWHTLQQSVPLHFIVPASLLIAFLVLVALCAVSLVLMVRVVLRPSMSQVLRFDEGQSNEYMTRDDAIMARSAPRKTLSRQATRAARPSIITLALWQLRRVWLLWLVQGVGIVAAVAIVCIVPLLSTVTSTAELHDVLSATPTTSELTLDASTQGLSSKVFAGVQQQTVPLFQHQLGSYLSSSTPLFIQTSGFRLLSPSPTNSQDEARLIGTSMEQAASSLHLIAGRLPRGTTSGEIEALLTPETAQRLHVTTGSLIVLRGDFFTKPQEMFGGPNPTGTLKLRIVGLFALTANASFWHGETFQPGGTKSALSYPLLVPSDAFMAALDQMAAAAHSATIFSPETFELTWRYHLNVAHVAVSQLDDLSNRLAQLQASVANKFSNIQNQMQPDGLIGAPYLVQVNLYNPAVGSYDIVNTLDQYRNRSAVVAVPLAVLSLQILALILFFVGLLVNLLVDWQADNIAILRSRGASNSQVFAALLAQSLSLGLVALVLGPLLAALVVSFIAQQLLGAAGQGLLPLTPGALSQAAVTVGWYAAGTLLAVLIVMVLLLRQAVGRNYVSVRQEAARVTRPPLWQRLNLDIIAAFIALVGYAISVYLASLSNLFDTRTKALVSAPLALVAPIFLLVAALLLFLRVFPLLLRLGERFAIRSRGSISMLALAQVARTPRQTLRMTLLLALAIAFAIFTLVFSASQTQRIGDIASYESGADFSGDIAMTEQHLTVGGETTLYHHISGVDSATVGFTGTGASAGTPTIPLQIRAVDAATFARTAIWTPQDSAQSLSSLMRTLLSTRKEAASHLMVPVIIDAATRNALNIAVGNTFTITVNSLPYSTLDCVVVAAVQHIPTVNDSAGAGTGGLLLDYSSYANLYAINAITNSTNQVKIDPYLPINHVWLRAQSNPAALAHIRSALAQPALSLANLYDRQMLIDTMSTDPLYLSLIILLTVGAVTTLLLTLVGDLLASWLGVRSRLTGFAVLRSLGATPLQVTGALLWEQGIIYIAACFTGILFGIVLSVTVVPALTFTSTPAGGVLSSISIDEFYVIQHIVPTQIVIPLSLALAFVVLAVLCIVALATMANVVLRPSMSQTLRLNED